MRKNAPSEELADAIRRVAKGQRFLDPALVEHALEVGVNPLTTRETEVLRAAADGGSTEEIGSTLFLSPATVRNYLSNAITKLDARNRIDAIRIARESGWL
jgi:two-component system response regulator DesR